MIHGSNNETRIGAKLTGDYLNVKEPILKTLLNTVKQGMRW